MSGQIATGEDVSGQQTTWFPAAEADKLLLGQSSPRVICTEKITSLTICTWKICYLDNLGITTRKSASRKRALGTNSCFAEAIIFHEEIFYRLFQFRKIKTFVINCTYLWTERAFFAFRNNKIFLYLTVRNEYLFFPLVYVCTDMYMYVFIYLLPCWLVRFFYVLFYFRSLSPSS